MSYKKNAKKSVCKVISTVVIFFTAMIIAVVTTPDSSDKLEHRVDVSGCVTTSMTSIERALSCTSKAVTTTTPGTNVSATSSSVTNVTTTIPVTTVTTVTTTTATEKEEPEVIPMEDPEPVAEPEPVVEEEPYYEPEPEPEPVYEEPEYYEEPSSDGLTCIGSFSRGTFYTGSYGGSGRALMDCAYGGDGTVKGSIASRYLYDTYGYNYNGERTKVYLEVLGYPSMDGWYYLDDASADYGYYGGMVDSSGYSYSGWVSPYEVIDFAYWYNSNCQFYGQGVVHVTAYM